MNQAGNGTWILVADGSRARVVSLARRRGRIRATAVWERETETLPTRELVSDRPGRVGDRVGPHRHAAEPTIDAHRQEKLRFAREVAEYLDGALHRTRFDRLVVIAPPRMLGNLRDALPACVRRHVTSEVPKDYTQLTLHELGPRLANELGSTLLH